MRYWPVTIETAVERVELLVEATSSSRETAARLIETGVRAGYGPIALVLDSAAAVPFASLAATYPGCRPLVLTIGPAPVEAPAAPRGRVTALAELVARN